jgi:hypothetical protein
MGVMEKSPVKMRRRTISIGMPMVVYMLVISNYHGEQICCRRVLTSIAKFSK